MDHNGRQLQHLGHSTTKTVTMSADSNMRQIRAWDDGLKVSETEARSADYSRRRLKSLRDWIFSQ